MRETDQNEEGNSHSVQILHGSLNEVLSQFLGDNLCLRIYLMVKIFQQVFGKM